MRPQMSLSVSSIFGSVSVCLTALELLVLFLC